MKFLILSCEFSPSGWCQAGTIYKERGEWMEFQVSVKGEKDSKMHSKYIHF